MPVERLELSSRPLLDGRPFGPVGSYVESTGAAFFALDPAHPANAVITDLGLAPRAADGLVRCSADLRILAPADPARGNGAIFLDVPNRGQTIFERMIEPGPMGPNTRVTRGFLLERGYTVVTCGWQHDVPRGNGRFGLTAPEALVNGQRITGRITTMRQIDVATDEVGPFDGSDAATAYAAADVDEPTATLQLRDDPSGPATLIPRSAWRFARRQGEEVVPDPYHVLFPAGFEVGKTYELSFTAVGASVTGIGFLALRDLVSHLRYAEPDRGLRVAIALGGSQTARVLRHLLYLGGDVDEQGRPALEGLLAVAAGARMTEANWRFGQPGTQGPLAAVFPFTDAVQTDPLSGRRDGLVARVTTRGRAPRVIHLNTSSEYVASAAITHVGAALSHLTAEGQADLEVPETVRIYVCAGTQHASSPLPLGPSDVPTGPGDYPPNTIDYKPFVRAAVDNLLAWIVDGTPPPPSRYPRLADGTLVERDAVRAALPGLPGPTLPPRRYLPRRTAETGFDASDVPAGTRAPDVAPDLVSAVDADGNELGGLRHPDVSVPLATYTGWNPRRANAGGDGTLLVRSTGATIPFAATDAARQASDTRPSITARYPDRGAFLHRVEAAARALVAERYLLADEVDALVAESGARYDQFVALGAARV